MLKNSTFILVISLLLSTTHSFATETTDENNNVTNNELRLLLQQAIKDSDSFEDRFDAEVWLVDMSNRLKNKIKKPEKRLKLLRQIHREASRANLHPELVLAVIDVESNFDRFAISKAGAQGLMQVMPFWLKEIGKPRDSLFNVRTNLRMGCTILKYYLKKEKGDLTRALARYNGSLGRYKYPNKVFKLLNKRWYKQ
ncbi:MAG: lytic transglycosylase domain-containing protein [Gammaproteobacteria bacterium]|nr:lytic transglycosylase domain-containing protein [Gammaproteobacteria bacterium]